MALHKTQEGRLQGVDSGDHSTVEPPVPIPNTEVKRCSADGSATKGRVRVGRCQNYLLPHLQGGEQNAHSVSAGWAFFIKLSREWELSVFP